MSYAHIPQLHSAQATAIQPSLVIVTLRHLTPTNIRTNLTGEH